MNKSEDGSGRGQGTSAGYKITDGHCVLPHGNPTKGKDLEEGRRDYEEKNSTKGTICERKAQDRQMWKQHADAFAHPRVAMAAQ